MLFKARHKGKQDQHDGCGINGVQHRSGQPDDGSKAEVRYQHTGHSKKSGKGRVGDAGQKLMKILTHAGDQAHAGVEACDHKNGRNKHKARPTEQRLCQSGEHLGTGGKARIHRAGLGPGVAQHGVDHQHQPACNKTGPDGAALHGTAFCDTPGADVQGNDRAKIQPGQRVHGLVAVQDALHSGQGCVLCAGCAVVCRQRMDETPGKQHHDEHDQAGAEDAAQPVGKLFRPQRHQKGRCKKQHRVGQLQPGTAAYQRHQHLEGGTGGAGDGKAGPDGKIHQNGEHHGEHRMHPAGKLIQTACPCHSHHARNGQADGADGKARKGRPEAGTGLCAQMRREDQIACTKKHGK